MVIHFKIAGKNDYKIKNISNLEKLTNLIFSNKRKMINKKIKTILSAEKLKKIPELNLNLRPEEVSPSMFYKITKIYEDS